MAIEYLKRAQPRPLSENRDLRDVVQTLLQGLEEKGEAEAERLAKEFDGYSGPIIVSDEDRAKAADQLDDQIKADIRFAHNNIRRFAEAQRATIMDCEIELMPGFRAGQKLIPVNSAGCYVPGGRYAHIASAMMTITTAKAAGVPHIVAASPTSRDFGGLHPAMIYTMDLCGADTILNLGGVQAVAAMAQGMYGLTPADIIVGPGNQYVAEAKRMLFGHVGIDMMAGPTDVLIIADDSADPYTVAWDLVGQAEHGYNSPVWLVTTSRALAEEVMRIVPDCIKDLPEVNATSATLAWDDEAAVILCDTAAEMAQVSDDYAPEHLHVQADDLDWWLRRLKVYGSLFLGKDTTVAFGDKCTGPNHVLPTSKAARYTGGLSVHKFLKIVTWQRTTPEGAKPIAEATARISRLEGMEAHARTADLRR